MNMKKRIFIITGYARSGKDTFCNILANYARVFHVSIVDLAKRHARAMGWNGKKTEKSRRFISDIKIAIDAFNDGSFQEVARTVELFMRESTHDILCIDMRETKDICRAVKEWHAEVIQIERKGVQQIISNVADAQAISYIGEKVIIPNHGTIEEFQETVKKFAETLD